jgi:hypothetical protein
MKPILARKGLWLAADSPLPRYFMAFGISVYDFEDVRPKVKILGVNIVPSYAT